MPGVLHSMRTGTGGERWARAALVWSRLGIAGAGSAMGRQRMTTAGGSVRVVAVTRHPSRSPAARSAFAAAGVARAASARVGVPLGVLKLAMERMAAAPMMSAA